jgi:hypothetical protein
LLQGDASDFAWHALENLEHSQQSIHFHGDELELADRLLVPEDHGMAVSGTAQHFERQLSVPIGVHHSARSLAGLHRYKW